MSDGSVIDLREINQITQVKKMQISYIAVINLQIVQKLCYLLERCEKLSDKLTVKFDSALLRS